MFKPKKKNVALKVPEQEEVDENDVEVEEEEEVEETEEPKQVPKQEGRITKLEVVDVIEGNLNRAMQLLQYLRN
jgi:hypothetical protein